MERLRARTASAVLLLVVVLSMPSGASAYSLLAHEALIDASWDVHIEPLLKRRYPAATPDALETARAYAYGGSLIQDLGYYPFGSRLFSNLVHYVRSGDFVEALLGSAADVNDYAFALGALAHYAGDTVGHGDAVNHVVPVMYPKLLAEHGNEVIYAASPTRHLMVEFAFDVLQAARGRFKSDVYQRLIGFEVATPLLGRAFADTYGLQLTDVFGDVDLAIGTYRRAASELIPDVTRAAWRAKHDEILASTPGITEQDFVYTLTPRQYDDAFGATYRKPGFFARFVVAVFAILPKFGPFRSLAFEPLTPDAERTLVASFDASTARFRASLGALDSGGLSLPPRDLDTGREPLRGVNPLADETYADLLAALAETSFAGVPPALRRDITAHYAAGHGPQETSRKVRNRERDAARHLAALNAGQPQTAVHNTEF